MAEHRFTVGKEERHVMSISHSATTGKASIIVSGKPIVTINGRGLRPISRTVHSVTVTFTIGVKEKHKVNVRITGPFWNHFEAFSDTDRVFMS